MSEPPLPLRTGLPPVIGTHPRVLILGSFPSEKSLDTGQYYANTRNQFWPLLGATFGFDAALAYMQRTATLVGHGVALWDVVHSCRRAGSLDSKIDRKSLVLNDFDAFLTTHPTIDRIFANGSTAQELFHRATGTTATVEASRLPSSSAALTMSFADKLAVWQAVR